MSSYWNTTDGELIYKDKDADKILKAIKERASSSTWNMFGWADKIRNAECLNDVFMAMGVNMQDTGVDDEIVITLENTYDSAFLGPMLSAARPWLQDSQMTVENDSNYAKRIITVRNHKLVPAEEILKSDMKSEMHAVVSYWIGEEGDTNVWLYDSEKEAVDAMCRLYEKSHKFAQEDDNFDEERSYHEEYEARVAWNDELYRIFEVRPISAKEEI